MPRKTRAMVKLACLVFAAILVILLACAILLFYLNEAPKGRTTWPARVEIKEGESAIQAGGELEEAGLIKSRQLWNLVCHFDRAYLKTGVYRIDAPTRLSDLHKIFVEGKQELTRVTVPEGSTLRKTAALFEAAGVCSAAQFVAAALDKQIIGEYHSSADSLEGYLFPDTYVFAPHLPAPRVVRTLVDNFFEKLTEIGVQPRDLTSRDLHQNVILASIIEREYRVDDEAKIMAGVFNNRLKRGMRLESCATVVYIITEIEGKPHPERLFFRDLDINNPYNTYLYKGLPPGPISSPGIVALDAAFHPARNEYLYFRVIDPAAGRHYFSKTFDDHIKAGTLYTKKR